MASTDHSPLLPDILPRDRRLDARAERAGRSSDSALVYGMQLVIAQQEREIAELRRAGVALMSTAQVAERLGVSPGSIRQWSERGQLACVILPGGERRFTVEAIDALLAACERHPSVPA